MQDKLFRKKLEINFFVTFFFLTLVSYEVDDSKNVTKTLLTVEHDPLNYGKIYIIKIKLYLICF